MTFDWENDKRYWLTVVGCALGLLIWQFGFVGGGIRWLGSRGAEYGSAEVYVDDQLVDTVTSHSSKLENMQELFVSEELEFGAHTVEVRSVPEQTEDGSVIISVDGFDVLPARIPTH